MIFKIVLLDIITTNIALWDWSVEGSESISTD